MKTCKGYEYIEHTGDVGIKVYGSTYEALFQNAWRAFFEIITEVERVNPVEKKIVTVESDGIERLLVSWLNEFLYLFDVDGWLFRNCEIQSLTESRVEAVAWGEKFDSDRHEMKTEIKAVTYHQLSIQRKKGRWETIIIFDI
jgi:SHS2 domain-containing protein